MSSWGKEIGSALREGPGPNARARQRARFIKEARNGPSLTWREWMWGLAAAAAGALLVAMIWKPSAPSGYVVPPLQEDTYVFNDGSRVKLGSETRAVIQKALGNEVAMVLEQGLLDVAVTPGLGSRWSFRGGNNWVRVKGTQFTFQYEPHPPLLKVQVSEGRVEVETSDRKIHSIGAGETFQWPSALEPKTVKPDIANRNSENISESAAAGDVVSAPGSSADLAVVREPVGGATSPRTNSHELKHNAEKAMRDLPPEWKRHAEKGRNAKAVALVEEQGLERALLSASSADYLLLADAARLARRGDLAKVVLKQLCEHFSGTEDAAEAMFRVGRLEFDAHNWHEAAQAFKSYLQSTHEGELVAEAMGRRVDALRRANDEQASDAAREYLARFPQGAYSTLAHQILQNP